MALPCHSGDFRAAATGASGRRGRLSSISAEREVSRLERDRLAISISRGATFPWY